MTTPRAVTWQSILEKQAPQTLKQITGLRGAEEKKRETPVVEEPSGKEAASLTPVEPLKPEVRI